MKLFVVEQCVSGVWQPEYLHEGQIRNVLANAQARMGLCVRVKRVKTPAEWSQLGHLPINQGIGVLEWVY